MTSPTVTIAWTESEAVLFGPDSRYVRQPLADDDDRPAMILETWRTEFPEISSAQLLAGRAPGGAPDVARLVQLAGEAGLRLELAPPPGETRRRRSRWALGRSRKARRTAVAGAVAIGAAVALGWQWSKAREQERLGRLTAAERESELHQAETAAAGRQHQAANEQARGLLAACSAPRQFQSAWLNAVATNIPAAVVLSSIELSGAHCRMIGRSVAGAPGAEGAVETLRQAVFTPATEWTMEPAGAARTGGIFRLEAAAAISAPPPGGPAEIRPEAAAAARARLPGAHAVQSFLQELAPSWRIEARGIETTFGIERRRYELTALAQDGGAWTNALQLVRRLNDLAGAGIETMTLVAAPGESGRLEKAQMEVSVRVRP